MDQKYFTNRNSHFSLILTAEVINILFEFCTKSGKKETGGILVGHYSNDLTCAYITHASGPGRGSVHKRFSFFRAVGQLQNWLNNLWSNGVFYYIGEWHFHPDSSPEPSMTDRNQMLSIAQNLKASCPEPILIVIGGFPSKEWSLSANIFTQNGDIVTLSETKNS